MLTVEAALFTGLASNQALTCTGLPSITEHQLADPWVGRDNLRSELSRKDKWRTYGNSLFGELLAARAEPPVG
jgi:hypothetical protein